MQVRSLGPLTLEENFPGQPREMRGMPAPPSVRWQRSKPFNLPVELLLPWEDAVRPLARH